MSEFGVKPLCQIFFFIFGSGYLYSITSGVKCVRIWIRSLGGAIVH